MSFTPYIAVLPESIQQTIKHIVNVAQPQKIVLFGSRARGNHRSNSDVDLAVFGKTCSDSQWNTLLVDIAEEPFSLYVIDLVDHNILSEDYEKQISCEGKAIYECGDKL